MQKATTLCLLVLLLMGCNSTINKEQMDITRIKIDPSEAIKPVKFSKLFVDLKYIQLETDKNCVIGNIDKIIHTENKIIIMDSYITKSIYIFDTDGKINSVINKSGRGPGEYTELTDFTFDSNDNNILIFCGATHKLLFYSLDGKFINELNTNFQANFIQYISPDRLAFLFDYKPENRFIFNSKYPNLLITNKKGRPIHKDIYFRSSINFQVLVQSLLPFSNINENIKGLKIQYNDTIYHLTRNSIVAKYYIDFGDLALNEKFWDLIERGDDKMAFNNYLGETGKCNIIMLHETDSFIFILYNRYTEYHYVFYSKRTEKIIDLVKGLKPGEKPIPLINDIDGYSDFIPITTYKDKFYYIIESSIITKMKRDNNINTFNPDIQDLLDKTTEYSNPIIVEVRIKDF